MNLNITDADIAKGKRNEERNEAMNMMNSAQKANSKAFNKGYDGIKWGKPAPMREYYAYRHVNNSIHVKRYRPELQRGDIDEAVESDFVVRVAGPYEAEGRTDALLKARELLNENN